MMETKKVDKEFFQDVVSEVCANCNGSPETEFEFVNGSQTMCLDPIGNIILAATYKCPVCGHTIKVKDSYVPATTMVCNGLEW